MAAQYSLDELDLDAQRQQIVALWAANLANGSPAAAQAKLNSGYLQNPFGRGMALGLRGDAGQPVGVICLHARTWHLGAETLRAANLADYAVDSAHRTLGPALMLMKRAVAIGQQHYDLLFGLPNPKAAAVCVRAGLRRIGALQRYVRVLSSRRLLESRVPAGLVGGVARVVDAGIRATEGLARVRYGRQPSCEPAAFDDPAVDQVWRCRSPEALLSDRSAASLHWRFASPGREVWRLCLAHDGEGRLVGRVAWRMRSQMAEVGDFLACDGARGTAALMNAFAGYARAQGADTVSLLFFGADAVVQALAQSGFHLRDESQPVYIGPQLSDARLRELSSRWYFTGYDNDDD